METVCPVSFFKCFLLFFLIFSTLAISPFSYSVPKEKEAKTPFVVIEKSKKVLSYSRSPSMLCYCLVSCAFVCLEAFFVSLVSNYFMGVYYTVQQYLFIMLCDHRTAVSMICKR